MFFLIFYVKLSNLSVAANQLTKPLASKSDKHLISPHSIIAKSNIKFLRIKEVIIILRNWSFVVKQILLFSAIGNI